MHEIQNQALAKSNPHLLRYWPVYWQKLLPLSELLVRIYLASVFFKSGMTKISNWPVTLELFTDEYHVPLLSPALAAYSATAGELILPVLLVFGFARHFASLGLFILNMVAVISYYHVLQDMPAAIEQHKLWGMLLLILSLLPTHYLCLDFYLRKSTIIKP